MYRWEKLGQLIHPGMFTDRWWMQDYIQSPATIVLEDKVRMYFCSRNKPDELGRYCSYIGYIDLDNTNPLNILGICNEPLLSLGDTGTFDEFGHYPVTAIKNGKEIKLYYGGITRCESVPFNAAIGGAYSTDGGSTFSKYGPGPVISYTPDEPFVVGSPKVKIFNGKYYVWYASGRAWRKKDNEIQPVYKIRGAVSEDGINWKKFNRNLLNDILEEDECQASGDVTFANGQYHMFYSYRYNYGFKTPGRGYRCGYATSTDLENWTRKDELAGLSVSESGWDSESISYPHLFQVGDKYYALYQGNYMGREGIGIAALIGDLK